MSDVAPSLEGVAGQGFNDMGLAVLRAAFSQLQPNEEGFIRKEALAEALQTHGVSADADDFHRLSNYIDRSCTGFASFPEFAAALALLNCHTPTPSPMSPVDVVSLLEDALSHRPQHEATGEVGLQQLDEVSESFEDCVERDDTDALRNRIAALQARQVALEQGLTEAQHEHQRVKTQLVLQQELNKSLTVENQRLHIECLQLTQTLTRSITADDQASQSMSSRDRCGRSSKHQPDQPSNHPLLPDDECSELSQSETTSIDEWHMLHDAEVGSLAPSSSSAAPSWTTPYERYIMETIDKACLKPHVSQRIAATRTTLVGTTPPLEIWVAKGLSKLKSTFKA